MALDNDLFGGEDLNLNDAENALATHGAPPEGVYHAMLDAVGTKPLPSGDAITVLKFMILAGPCKGKIVEEELWPAKNEADPERRKKKANRNGIFAHRLGWLAKDANGVAIQNPGKSGFIDCVGGPPVFIDVKNKTEEWTNKKGQKASMVKAILAFEGILTSNDKRVKDVPIGKPVAPSKPSAGGSSSQSGGGSKSRTMEDI